MTFDPRKLIGLFRDETEEHLRILGDGLLALESDPANRPAIAEVFRAVHSIKGSARMLRFTSVAELAHLIEDVLDDVRHDQLAITPRVLDALFAGLDGLRASVAAVVADQPAPTTLDALFGRLVAVRSGAPAEVEAAAADQPASPPPAAATVAEPAAPAAPPPPRPDAAPEPSAPPPPSGPGGDGGVAPADDVATGAVAVPSERGETEEAPDAPAPSVPAPTQAGGQSRRRVGILLPRKGERAEVASASTAPPSPPSTAGEASSVAAPTPVLAPTEEPTGPPAVQPAAGVSVPAPARPAAAPPAPASKAAPIQPADAGRARVDAHETMRVSVEKVDKLLNLAGELTIRQLEMRELVSQLGLAVAEIERNDRERLGRSGMTGSDRRTEARQPFQQLHKLIRRVAEAAAELTDDLHHEVTRVRMLPVATIFDAYPVAVRDLAHAAGKTVRLVVEGSDTELDRTILLEMRDPLLHLVRNAIDHGIESGEERRRLGKPPTGVLRLAAYEQGSQAVIEVSDDGAGLDPDHIRRTAVDRGHLSAAAASVLSDADAMDLIFQPGFTTSERITETSGRGVGLDVVRSRVEALKGQVRVQTSVGKGTTFFLELPLTLAFTRVLLVFAAGQILALPVTAIQHIEEVDLTRLATVQTRETIRFAGSTIPLVRLASALRMREPNGTGKAGDPARPAKLPAVILGKGERQIAFLVEEVLNEDTLVVKSLGPVLRRVPRIAAGAILGSGRVVLMLNVPELLASARSAGVAHAPAVAQPATAAKQRQRHVLVVDDTLTTRELERSILLAAGYAVEAAEDGLQALERLHERASEGPIFDLIVTDIEMPRMNGFELTESVRKDNRYADVPIVIVTSRASEEDRRRGLEAGAQAYIVKSAFDQSNLLATIDRLVS